MGEGRGGIQVYSLENVRAVVLDSGMLSLLRHVHQSLVVTWARCASFIPRALLFVQVVLYTKHWNQRVKSVIIPQNVSKYLDCMKNVESNNNYNNYSNTRTHARTRTHTLTHARTHARTLKLTPTPTNTYTHIHTRARAHTHTHTYTYTRTHSRTHAHTHTHTHTHRSKPTYTHTHTHTNTHTGTCNRAYLVPQHQAHSHAWHTFAWWHLQQTHVMCRPIRSTWHTHSNN